MRNPGLVASLRCLLPKIDPFFMPPEFFLKDPLFLEKIKQEGFISMLLDVFMVNSGRFE